jgi:hypothetical protein
LLFNQSMLPHFLVFFSISRALLASFFVERMPHEIGLTPIHLVIDVSIYKAFRYRILRDNFQASRIHRHISVSVALLRRPVGVGSYVFCYPLATWQPKVCFKRPTDYDVDLLHRTSHTLWYDQQVALLSSQLTSFSVVWSRKLFKTNTDRWRKDALGRRNQTDLIQSWTAYLVI